MSGRKGRSPVLTKVSENVPDLPTKSKRSFPNSEMNDDDEEIPLERKVTRKAKSKPKEKIVTSSNEDDLQGRIKKDVEEIIDSYLKEFEDEDDLLRLPIETFRESLIGGVDRVFRPYIERRNSIIAQRRKECKKSYKMMIRDKIPGFVPEKCSVCKRSELSVQIHTTKCKHKICYACIQPLEELDTESPDDSMDTYTVRFKCPTCRHINTRQIKEPEEMHHHPTAFFMR